MALVDKLETAWYGGARAPLWAWPLAALYGLLTGWRRWLFRRGWLHSQRLSVPVIVIGNLSVGGTGKTPLTIAVAAALLARGCRPGVVSRGHGGSQREPMLLGNDATPTTFGDEPCLIHAAGVPVAVGRDRPAAAQRLIDAGCDVVIADDGLQHYRLARDVEICVIDGQRRFGNGHLLPAGPLREPLRRLARVDLRVCNGGLPQPGEFPMTLVGGSVVNLRDGSERRLEDFRGQRVHAVAAIGNPQRFFDSLRDAGIDLLEHPFSDHHAFDLGDLDFDDTMPVLMTDKDAVKCTSFAAGNWWRVPVKAVVPDEFFDQLQRALGQGRQHF